MYSSGYILDYDCRIGGTAIWKVTKRSEDFITYERVGVIYDGDTRKYGNVLNVLSARSTPTGSGSQAYLKATKDNHDLIALCVTVGATSSAE